MLARVSGCFVWWGVAGDQVMGVGAKRVACCAHFIVAWVGLCRGCAAHQASAFGWNGSRTSTRWPVLIATDFAADPVGGTPRLLLFGDCTLPAGWW